MRFSTPLLGMKEADKNLTNSVELSITVSTRQAPCV